MMIQENEFFRDFSIHSTEVQSFLILGLIVILFLIVNYRHKRPRKRWRKSNKYIDLSRPADLSDPKDQMEAIARVHFETTKLLNREEARILPILEAATREFGNGHRVMAQTSLGELIRPKGKPNATPAHSAAYASINSKRLDFAIINRFGRLVAAIEYQGTGHYHRKSFMRDAVKREAVRKAGVEWIEITPEHKSQEIRERLRRLLTQPHKHTA